jgi:hypothetical protein
MKLTKETLDEVKAIANDVIDNEQKSISTANALIR